MTRLLILLSALALLVNSKNVFVDVSLPSASGDTYPTLDEAFVALLDTNAQIIDYNNSIVLLSSCASQILTYTGGIVRGLDTGGNLEITFPSLSQQISQFSDCSQLPIISPASASSYLEFSNLDSLVISGITFQYSATTIANQIFNVSKISFSSFCFNNTEPTLESIDSLSSELVTTFKFDQVLSFLMSNGVYIYDSVKSLVITGADQVNLASMNFVVLNSTKDLINQGLNISAPSLAPTAVSISDMTVTCDSGGIRMPTLIWTSNITSVTLSSMKMCNCNFNLTTTFTQSLFMIYLSLTQYTHITDVYVNNSYIGTSEVIGKNMYLVYVQNPTIGTPINVDVSNWLVANSSINYYGAIFYVYATNGNLLESVKIQNMSLIDSTMYYFGYFIYINSYIYMPANTTTLTPTTFQISQIQLLRNDIQSSCKVIYLLVNGGATLYASLEVVQFNATNLTFEGNTVSASALLQFGSLLLHVVSLQARNNMLTNAAFVIRDTVALSSLVVMDSIFANLSFSQLSGAISHNISMSSTVAATGVECNAVNRDDGYIYAITRPFIVSNCTFENLTLESGSALIQSNNPMIVINNNTFNNLEIFDSKILELIEYLSIITTESYCAVVVKIRVTATGYVGTIDKKELPTTSIIYPFYEVENLMFQGLDKAAAAFYKARNASWAYDSVNSVYFLSVIENTFTNMQVSDAKNLMTISQIITSNSSVTILNNTMSNSSVTSTGLFSSENVFRLFWSGNMFTNSAIQGYFLTINSGYLTNLMIASDFADSINGQVGYYIESSKCESINLQSIAAQNLFVAKAFITVSCRVLTNQLVLNNSNFENVTCQNTLKGFIPINFLMIKVLRAGEIALNPPETASALTETTTSKIFLLNNHFRNHTLIEGGYASKLFDESIVVIFAVKSSILLENTSFEYLTGSVSGSIMRISMPSITVKNCTFDNLNYLNSQAAFNLVFETLNIVNTSFLNTKGAAGNGLGLMKFTNPNSKIDALTVTMESCVFQNNTAAYGTILSTESTKIQLVLINSTFSANLIRQQAGALIELYSLLDSSIIIQNTVFSIEKTASQQAFSGNLFLGSLLLLEKSLGIVRIEVTNSSINVDAGALGSFFTLHSNANAFVEVSDFNYSYKVVASSLLRARRPGLLTSKAVVYKILQADQVQAVFTRLTVSNVTLETSPLSC